MQTDEDDLAAVAQLGSDEELYDDDYEVMGVEIGSGNVQNPDMLTFDRLLELNPEFADELYGAGCADEYARAWKADPEKVLQQLGQQGFDELDLGNGMKLSDIFDCA